jgi:hypothetical protein
MKDDIMNGMVYADEGLTVGLFVQICCFILIENNDHERFKTDTSINEAISVTFNYQMNSFIVQ